jgi:ubiquinone/menaquinone biosynthesis C-methylase UbiE
MTTTQAPALDGDRMAAFAGRLMAQYVDTLMTYMLAIGWRSGAVAALAAGPATSAALAERSRLSERHLREWLGAMTTSGIAIYDAATSEYALPPEHAACLTGDGPGNTSPFAEAVAFMGRHVDAVTRTLEEGGGIPYSAYGAEFHELQDQINRRAYDAALIHGYVPATGLAHRLKSGVDVADIGCGRGHVLNLLGKAFPDSTFVGYDISAEALESARRESAAYGLTNVRFEVCDVADLPADAEFDVITAFDAIHDQVAPRRVLAELHRCLRSDGAFVMVDMDASSNVEDNVGNPVAPFLYAISLMHCLQVSLAGGGEGLGTAWGRQKAVELLREAGFGDVQVIDTPPEDPVNVIYVARP